MLILRETTPWLIGMTHRYLVPMCHGTDAPYSDKLNCEELAELVRSKGWDLVNADITIALQAPKIGFLVPEMSRCLAEVMGVDVDSVSVKATTTERLGFVGRGEGCEVWAVVLIGK